MSSKSEIEPENISIKFLSNADADGREATWKITLLGSILQSPLLWTVGPGNPQSQMTITVCFPMQWGPEPWSLGVRKFFMLTLPCRLGANEKGTHTSLNCIPLLFSRKTENHEPFLKTVRPILLMHMTLFLNLSGLR